MYVLISEPQCPVNEQYVQSPSLSCTPQTCSELGFPLNCTDATGDSKYPEKPGCTCIDDYVRNCEGVCIPKNNCCEFIYIEKYIFIYFAYLL